MLSDQNATNDLEAAMNNHRQLVFADLRDVSVFRRRLPIFAAHGYRPEET